MLNSTFLVGETFFVLCTHTYGSVIAAGLEGNIMSDKRAPCLTCGYLTLSAIRYCIICQSRLSLIEETVTEDMSDWDVVQDWRSRLEAFHESNKKRRGKNGVVVEGQEPVEE